MTNGSVFVFWDVRPSRWPRWDAQHKPGEARRMPGTHPKMFGTHPGRAGKTQQQPGKGLNNTLEPQETRGHAERIQGIITVPSLVSFFFFCEAKKRSATKIHPTPCLVLEWLMGDCHRSLWQLGRCCGIGGAPTRDR